MERDHHEEVREHRRRRLHAFGPDLRLRVPRLEEPQDDRAPWGRCPDLSRVVYAPAPNAIATASATMMTDFKDAPGLGPPALR